MVFIDCVIYDALRQHIVPENHIRHIKYIRNEILHHIDQFLRKKGRGKRLLQPFSFRRSWVFPKMMLMSYLNGPNSFVRSDFHSIRRRLRLKKRIRTPTRVMGCGEENKYLLTDLLLSLAITSSSSLTSATFIVTQNARDFLNIFTTLYQSFICN